MHEKVVEKRGSSQNWEKSRLSIAKAYERITNRRTDYLHKVSRTIANAYGTIVLEDLSIRSMLKNHCLAKSISDSSWNELVRMLAYKAEEAGGRVIVVDARGTSQECSGCGQTVPKTLKERTHSCPRCGLILDRDVNAARNILKRAALGTRGSNAWGDGTRAPSLNQETHHSKKCVVHMS